MRFQDVLRRQHGVITRAQARACGVSAAQLRRRIERGELDEVYPGVRCSRAHRVTSAMLVVAAARWAGPQGVLDGVAAAVVHRMLPRLPDRSRPVGVTVPRRVRRTVPGGIRLRRRDLAPADRVVRGGLGVTSPGLTALETAAALPDGAAFLDRVLQRGLPFADLLAAHDRTIGAAGITRARSLLVEAADRADSRAERRLIGHLRRAGITGFERGFPFGPWSVDLAFRRERLAVEVDGWAFHSGPDRFRADRRKQNALVGAGWTVLRFTWQDIRDRPGQTVARIRRALGP
ncbi:type IV toxin-antitoxin system AbiEi family antitoxin domain-containing protein [Pseudonocardia sp. NPDC046786]|uniref:type IV toxin-antitoxin system AbiEi family antitoxin domain-containing protein n=1 Tax=Pseudonocardia sp. NPDC046786 TaxID=3155471 RepID=UPI0033C10D78